MIYPIFAMVLLTLLVWLRMYHIRFTEMHKNRIGPEEMTMFNRDLPRRIITSGDNLRNLFELPVLFYLVAALIMLSGRADPVFEGMSWAFVTLRYIHSFIHMGYNRVAHRFAAYAAGALVLWLIWFRFAWLLLTA